jgi:tetratricopeptide (TPR) repeat protein
LIGKGIALTTLGRHEEALETCNKALEIDPDDEKALILKNNYGYL